mgnify:CR=1 FL=1
MQTNWEKTLKEYESSGLSVANFCAERDIAKQKFYYWKKKLSKASQGSFLKINTEHSSLNNSQTEILYPNGVKLRINGSVKVSELKALLNV